MHSSSLYDEEAVLLGPLQARVPAAYEKVPPRVFPEVCELGRFAIAGSHMKLKFARR